MKKIGKISATSFIVLESKEGNWRMLVNNVIPKLDTSGLIKNQEGEKVRIKLTIKTIAPPENIFIDYQKQKENDRVFGDMGKKVNSSLLKVIEFLNQSLSSNIWVFIGYIDGKIQIPVTIIHFKEMNISIYNIIKKNEDFNPQLN